MIVVGALMAIAGAIALTNTFAATAATITVMLAALFMVGGGMRFFAALAMQPAYWGWLMVNGFVTFMLGVLRLFGMPLTGLTGPGLLVGVDLFLSGVTAIAFGFETRRAASRVTHGGIARLAG